MGIALVICLFILLGIAFDLGRKWERMEWDGSFDEQESRPTPHALDGATGAAKEQARRNKVLREHFGSIKPPRK